MLVKLLALRLARFSAVPALAAESIHLSVDASKPGAKIDRNIFGQFAENLGHGLYEGIWVGAGLFYPEYSRNPQRCGRAR